MEATDQPVRGWANTKSTPCTLPSFAPAGASGNDNTRSVSTGCASGGYAAAPLHPWLQPLTPPGSTPPKLHPSRALTLQPFACPAVTPLPSTRSHTHSPRPGRGEGL